MVRLPQATIPALRRRARRLTDVPGAERSFTSHWSHRRRCPHHPRPRPHPHQPPPIRAAASCSRASSARRSSSTTSTSTRRPRCWSSRTCSSRPATRRPRCSPRSPSSAPRWSPARSAPSIFGHLGDKHGRKATLVGALLTMGIATFLIGLLPTYAMVGWLAPLLLVILRIAQGFALGGEWSGAALVATENAPDGQARLVRHVPAARRAHRLHHRERPVPRHRGDAALRRPVDAVAGVPRLGLAHPVPVLGRHGDRRPLGAAAPRRVDRLLEGVEGGQAHEAAARQRLPNHWKQLILGTFFMLATYVLFYLMTTFSLALRPRPASRRPRARCPVSATRTTPSC